MAFDPALAGFFVADAGSSAGERAESRDPGAYRSSPFAGRFGILSVDSEV